MGGKHRPARPRDRALGAELRAIRERAGLTLTDVAQEIQWNISTLSRLERGNRRISPETVMGLSVVYKLPTQQRNDLVSRAKEPAPYGWWDRPPTGTPSELAALAAYEHNATRLTTWSPGIIPGLLQTRPYAEAVLRDYGASEKDLSPDCSPTDNGRKYWIGGRRITPHLSAHPHCTTSCARRRLFVPN